MKSLKFIDRRVGYLLAAFAMLLGVLSPVLVPSQASAELLTARSIQLSSSKADANDVTAVVKFTTTAAAGAVIIDFCTQSALIGSTCTAPTGFNTTDVATPDSSTTVTKVVLAASDRGVKIVKDLSTPGVQTINLTGIDLPSGVESFYARILTYDDSTAANGYTSGTVVGTTIDEGGIALSTTSSIGVTAAVLETMTFCVAGGTAAITENCGDASSHAPNIELGETSGAVKALSPTAVSTGTIYTQLSTNAASGAVVNLKSSATSCGGLIRSGGSTCIGASSDDIDEGDAEFGVKTSTAYGTSGVTGATGTLAPVSASGYNNSTYFLDYPGNNTTGVTSPYGDPFIDTAGAPANNQNMDLTFGASISNSTAAGIYTADINLIATGTF